MGTSAVGDESVGTVVALASPASGAASVGPSFALASSVSIGTGEPPYADTLQAVAVIEVAPIAPAAKSAARDKRPASARVGPISALAVAPQNGQIGSPRLT